MLTLNVGFSKKQQGEEQYSSVGASCNLAVEAAEELIAQPEQLQRKIASIFDEVKAAVDQQIANGNGKGNGNGKAVANGNGSRVVTEVKIQPQVEPTRNGHDQVITPKQRQFVVALAQKKFQGGIKAFEAHLQEEGIASISMLTRRQASQIIDSLAGNRGGK